MEHEKFPVPGFEFMDEPATDEQKKIIVELAAKANMPVDPQGRWPDPFSKWDAGGMITALEDIIKNGHRIFPPAKTASELSNARAIMQLGMMQSSEERQKAWDACKDGEKK